jgi:hypothetical protein
LNAVSSARLGRANEAQSRTYPDPKPKLRRSQAMAATCSPAPSAHCITVNVRYGSLADITARSRHVRFTPNNGHSSAQVARPLCAINGHSHTLRNARCYPRRGPRPYKLREEGYDNSGDGDRSAIGGYYPCQHPSKLFGLNSV